MTRTDSNHPCFFRERAFSLGAAPKRLRWSTWPSQASVDFELVRCQGTDLHE